MRIFLYHVLLPTEMRLFGYTFFISELFVIHNNRPDLIGRIVVNHMAEGQRFARSSDRETPLLILEVPFKALLVRSYLATIRILISVPL